MNIYLKRSFAKKIFSYFYQQLKRNQTVATENVKCSKNSIVTIETFNNQCLKNEPILEYMPASEELKKLEVVLKKMCSSCEEIPIVIDGKEYKSACERYQVMPHKHAQRIAKFYHASEKQINKAIKVAVNKQIVWDRTPLKDRIAIWEKAASLMSKKYRADLVAATMLGQAKTIREAEIDAAAELVDFIRMNANYLKELTLYKPISADPETTINHYRFRGIEGFIAAISPFNFTAIGGNLAFTPALMGNSVLWKPSDTSILANYITFKIMREAGVPEGVVNFLPCDGPTFGRLITFNESLAGINFTGSVPTFQTLWKEVGKQIEYYKNFPRLAGECGGKNFHFVHPSADVESVVAGLIRSAFEYSGQKCSACSRLYVPESIWHTRVKESLITELYKLKVGDVMDYETFTSAVIDEKAFLRIESYIDKAKVSKNIQVIAGGTCNNLKGYFICPTVVEVKDPEDRLMQEEIFGPVLAVYVYKDQDAAKVLSLANKSKYALTGSVYADDENFLKDALDALKYSAGNFYINDKSTGSIVGQQPFGGGRLSGTNDKPGSPYYLLKWTSPQSIKETLKPMRAVYYPYMGVE